MKEEQAVRSGWKASRVYSQRLIRNRLFNWKQHNKEWREYHERLEDFDARVYEIKSETNVDNLKDYMLAERKREIKRNSFWWELLPVYFAVIVIVFLIYYIVVISNH